MLRDPGLLKLANPTALTCSLCCLLVSMRGIAPGFKFCGPHCSRSTHPSHFSTVPIFLSFFFFNYPSSLIWGVHIVLIVWQSTEAWSTHKGGSGRRPLGKLPLPHSQPTVHSSSVGVWSDPLAWSLRAVRPDSIQQPQLLCVPECWGPVLSRRHRFVLILPDPGLSQSS